MTPEQHATAASDQADANETSWNADEGRMLADTQLAHALLGRAAGTGTHYAAADAALAELAAIQPTEFSRRLDQRQALAWQALAHAAVADLA